MSVSFSDLAAQRSRTTPHAVEVGRRLAAQVPPPTRDNGGFLANALWWATNVGRVFPLSEAVADAAQPHAGKVPHALLGRDWNSETLPTRDPALVREWWNQAPLANVSVAVRVSGFVVLDVDPRHGGWDHLVAWAATAGIDLAEVPRALSPRNDGGCHLWWRLPPGATYPHSPLLPGVDRPWQVAVPHSMRWVLVDPDARASSHDFRPYRWYAGDPRVAPVAPLALLGPGSRSSRSDASDPAGSPPALLRSAGEVDLPRAEEGGIDVEHLAREGVPVGKQSYTFKRMACSMVAKGWDDATIVNTLLLTAERSPVGDVTRPWTLHDLRTTVAHARRFIEGERRRETLDNRQTAWAAGIGRRTRK